VNSQTFPNSNPYIVRRLGPGIFFSGLILFLASLLAASDGPALFTSSGAIVLIVVVALWVVLLAGFGLIYRTYRWAAPDAILIEPGAVVGIFGSHLLGPVSGSERRFDFSHGCKIREARSGYGFLHYFPAQITGTPTTAPHGQPNTPSKRAPRGGVTNLMFLTASNAQAARKAHDAWSGAASGKVLAPGQ
jgi:hypothetical protein